MYHNTYYVNFEQISQCPQNGSLTLIDIKVTIITKNIIIMHKTAANINNSSTLMEFICSNKSFSYLKA